MNAYWASITKKFGMLRFLRPQYELTMAYRRVFQGNPSREDQQIVLSDFAAKCGWNTITPSNVASKELWRREGKREAFAELFGHLSLSEEDIAAMENAIRHDVANNNATNAT